MELSPTDAALAAYHEHVTRMCRLVPRFESLLEAVLLAPDCVERVVLTLVLKRGQTQGDGKYHHAALAFPILDSLGPSFAFIEVGGVPSIEVFSEYRSSLGYDSYTDYIIGIFDNAPAACDLMFATQLADEDPEITMKRLIFGHFLWALKPATFFGSACWLGTHPPLMIMPAELKDGV